MIHKIICLTVIIALTGCATPSIEKRLNPSFEAGRHQLKFTFSNLEKDNIPPINQQKGPNKLGLAYMSCTNMIYVKDHPEGKDIYAEFKVTSDDTRIDLSKKYFDLALMSNNVYEDINDLYVLPDWNLLLAINSRSGLDMHVYGDRNNIKDSSKIVFAFGGTKQLSDWKANFSFVGYQPLQYKQAFDEVESIIKENPNAKFFATGHSLGGGIALNLAYQNPKVQSVVFNPSPRAFFKRKYKIERERRPVVFLEKGEILTGATFKWTKFRLGNPEIVNFNALDYLGLGQNFSEHNMYDLSRTVLHIALVHGDIRAKEYFTSNISKNSTAIKGENCSTYFEN